MTATLYHHVYSQHSRKVRILQNELGFDLDLVSVEVRPQGMGGENEQPEYLELNPNGKVPLLQDGDLLLWESNAIACYLAEKHGWSPLWPESLVERAQINKWQYWQVAHFSHTIDGFLWQSMRSMMGMGEADPEEIAKLEKQLGRWAIVLSAHLENSEYLALDRFTLADIAVASVLMHQKSSKFGFSGYPLVERWLDRVRERPSWQATEPPPMPQMPKP